MPQISATAGYTDGYRALGADVRARLAPGEDVEVLATRLRAAASAVREQVPLHVGLLALDWHGRAARAFETEVAAHLVVLERLAARLDEVADGAARQAAAGDALRAAAGWAS